MIIENGILRDVTDKDVGDNGCFEIPDGVKEIGIRAFAECLKLTKINIPDTVTHIGRGAFMDCPNLRIVNMGNGVKSIEPFTFYGDSVLYNVNIGDNVEIIRESAFAKCAELVYLNIPDKLRTMEPNAIHHCDYFKGLYLGVRSRLELPDVPRAVTECKNFDSVVIINDNKIAEFISFDRLRDFIREQNITVDVPGWQDEER